MEISRTFLKTENGTYQTPEGETCSQHSTPGYYETDGHYFHVRNAADILHVNPKGIINSVESIVVAPDEKIRTITKEEFENELHNVMIALSLGKYLRSK